ncbi:hypothetical protein BV25DRAFT_1841989 [Artomyces pyxidatus]|uniref:Uncharacterized protein n=1 Tax=Artomyces pyxidatus TaxID=48021 RepID=A0ACB8SMJ7_9AGAM|nr:hypothetical protein BV25DRAFT_1841989 [Artomyces pyxidatus]
MTGPNYIEIDSPEIDRDEPKTNGNLNGASTILVSTPRSYEGSCKILYICGEETCRHTRRKHLVSNSPDNSADMPSELMWRHAHQATLFHLLLQMMGCGVVDGKDVETDCARSPLRNDVHAQKASKGHSEAGRWKVFCFYTEDQQPDAMSSVRISRNQENGRSLRLQDTPPDSKTAARRGFLAERQLPRIAHDLLLFLGAAQVDRRRGVRGRHVGSTQALLPTLIFPRFNALASPTRYKNQHVAVFKSLSLLSNSVQLGTILDGSYTVGISPLP